MTNPGPTPRSDATVTLRPVTTDNGYEVIKLQVTEQQQAFVAPNVHSLAEAYLHPTTAWTRAIYADETLVGFLMLSEQPEKAEYYLWRFMIDHRYQGMGFGRQAIEQLIEHVRQRPGATELLLSYVPELEGGPEPFYRKLGFVPTGEIHDGEVVMRLNL